MNIPPDLSYAALVAESDATAVRRAELDDRIRASTDAQEVHLLRGVYFALSVWSTALADVLRDGAYRTRLLHPDTEEDWAKRAADELASEFTMLPDDPNPENDSAAQILRRFFVRAAAGPALRLDVAALLGRRCPDGTPMGERIAAAHNASSQGLDYLVFGFDGRLVGGSDTVPSLADGLFAVRHFVRNVAASEVANLIVTAP